MLLNTDEELEVGVKEGTVGSCENFGRLSLRVSFELVGGVFIGVAVGAAPVTVEVAGTSPVYNSPRSSLLNVRAEQKPSTEDTKRFRPSSDHDRSVRGAKCKLVAIPSG